MCYVRAVITCSSAGSVHACICIVYTYCRVWRYRGGRDGRETLQQFMGFLGRTKPGGELLHRDMELMMHLYI